MAAALSGLVDRSGLVELDWGRVFVTDVAPRFPSRPPLLLLHDVLSCGHAFAAITPDLAGERRVVVLDLPGAGESDRPPTRDVQDYSLSWLAQAVAAVLGKIGAASIDVLAQGFGGLVMLQLALDEPAMVRRMCAVAPPLAGIQLTHEQRLARIPAVGELAFSRVYRRADLRRSLGAARAVPERLDDFAVALYWDRLAREGGLEATRAMLLQIDHIGGLTARLQAIPQPVLFVWGDRDAWVTVEHAERSAALLPHARLSIVEGCGHAVAEECPDRLVALAREWLDAEGEVAAQ